MKAGILWELLGVSRRVGSMHPLQILEQRLTDEMSAGHSLLIVWHPCLRYMVHCGSPFCHQGHFEIPPPRFSFVVECHQCSDDHMLVCDQKTFLTHSVGLQINSSPEKHRRKISLEKNLDIQNLEEGLFSLISEPLKTPIPKEGSWAL